MSNGGPISTSTVPAVVLVGFLLALLGCVRHQASTASGPSRRRSNIIDLRRNFAAASFKEWIVAVR
jgi:hypothetical protein